MAGGEKPSVLIVDDNEATCVLIAAVLHRDFTTDAAGDGADAIEKLKTRTYAAVLLDLRMPHVDGFDVLDYLRERAPEIMRCVIVVTAAVSNREMQRVRGYGVHAVVTKPFEVDVLLDVVKRCVGESGGHGLGPVIYSSTGMILLLADLLRNLRP